MLDRLASTLERWFFPTRYAERQRLCPLIQEVALRQGIPLAKTQKGHRAHLRLLISRTSNLTPTPIPTSMVAYRR